MKKKIDIIWTLDKICCWHCSFCCVDAYYVYERKNKILIKSNGFNATIAAPSKKHNIYEEANKVLIKNGLALSLKEKLKILDNLKTVNPRIAFSGGDFLLIKENIKVVKKACKLFGKKNLSITTTGEGMKNGQVNKYLKYVGSLEFTYDNVNDDDVNHNQNGYNRSNLDEFIKSCKGKIETQALIPISKTNKKKSTIKKIYATLNSAGIDNIYLMRTFPVGRGCLSKESCLSRKEYINVIDEYRELEKKMLKPKVNIMCALKNLFPGLNENPCGFLKNSSDITSNGLLIADAFAYNQYGKALHQDLVLGDLKKDKILNIYSQERVKKIISRADENFGHCKIFAYLSNKKMGIEGFFSKSDPLYSIKSNRKINQNKSKLNCLSSDCPPTNKEVKN